VTHQPQATGRIQSTDTLREALVATAQALKGAAIETAAMDARFLLQGVLQLDPTVLIRDPVQLVGAKCDELNVAIERRLRQEPVSRIIGRRDFYGRSFVVTPDVLDPRADTETLVDLVLDTLKSHADPAGELTIVDAGVGSGAIIATLLSELPGACGIATDVSAGALDVARRNAAALGISDRLSLVQTRGINGVSAPFDILVSNPPYIRSGDIEMLARDVAAYDPRIALDGGSDGLTIYRELASDISAISRHCWLFFEVGAGQAADVEQIFALAGAVPRYRRKDLGGHVRAVALEIHR
jgi:release factor glutamine methyltransferase